MNETQIRAENGADYPEHSPDAPQGYVVGFLFRQLERTGTCEVALVRKAKPEWQAGLLNGVGGKIEPGETSAAAMVREWREETGSSVSNWRYYSRVSGPNWFVDFYARFYVETSKSSDLELWLKGSEEEPVDWYPVSEVLRRPDVISGLRWQIPLAIDQPLKGEWIAEVTIRERTEADVVGVIARHALQA